MASALMCHISGEHKGSCICDMTVLHCGASTVEGEFSGIFLVVIGNSVPSEPTKSFNMLIFDNGDRVRRRLMIAAMIIMMLHLEIRTKLGVVISATRTRGLADAHLLVSITVQQPYSSRRK